MGQNKVTFGTGEVTYRLNKEVDFESHQDELWDITMCLFGTGEVNI